MSVLKGKDGICGVKRVNKGPTPKVWEGFVPREICRLLPDVGTSERNESRILKRQGKRSLVGPESIDDPGDETKQTHRRVYSEVVFL